MFFFNIIMYIKYKRYKRLGYIKVFNIGLLPLPKLFADYYLKNKTYLMPNGRIANCKFSSYYKSDRNIIKVRNDQNTFFDNYFQEYFYVYKLYNYENSPQIKSCSFAEFKKHYSSLFFPELDNDEYHIMNKLTQIHLNDTENILGVWTKQCQKQWGK